ncbi:MAG: DUF192 domain-containing protein [Candidatus Nanohaloarchaea archaeon]
MKKETTASILLLAAVILVFLNLPKGPESIDTPYSASFTVGGEETGRLSLEVADSAEERQRGLMHRKSLPDDHGMLFVFPDEAERTFWMKDTLIPLDIIFISANLTVVDVDHAYPQPNATEEELTIYRSDTPAKFVIETRRGFAEENGITAGTKVSFSPELNRRYR